MKSAVRKQIYWKNNYFYPSYFEFCNSKFTTTFKKPLIWLLFYLLLSDNNDFLQLNNVTQIYFIKIGFIVAIYPFLRKFGIWKLFIVSFCVTAITAYVHVFLQVPLSDDTKILIVQRFLIVISLIIPFEILDSQTDDDVMKTLPQ